MLVALWALTQLWPILLLVATAFIFHAALLPYVEWLVGRGVPRTASVLLILFGILAVLAGLAALVVPAMVDEFADLRSGLPEDARDLEGLLGDFGVKVELEQRARDINWNELISGSAAVDFGQQALLAILTMVTIVVLTAYLLVDTP